ncbi:hypothetical protein HPB50_017526 [Hyalomma asiaticum]|uniref:Uncharacterized protein n=1 Tax=Hyalomma asiaticum TaxID=266040 RepID=A0ACB7RXE8_HYAAI|nr:hypothetical protein HPB50_017526 [Hyalomma asiaticum]
MYFRCLNSSDYDRGEVIFVKRDASSPQPGPGSCRTWHPDKVCARDSPAHFRKRRDCVNACEVRRQKRCLGLITERFLRPCSRSAEDNPRRFWYYDRVERVCVRIKEHVHRAMVCICCTTFAIAGLLGLLMLYLVYLAMHVGEPVRPRAAVETSTTTYGPPVYTGRLRHYKAGVSSECLRQPAFHVCLENDSFPVADRFDKWRGIDGNASGRPWYFLHGSCFEWTPESFCLDRSRAHFTNRKKCAQRCEKGGVVREGP